MTTIRQKVVYVNKQRIDIRHTCHWPGCELRVSPAQWGCRDHWFRLPTTLRNRIWKAYMPGQEISKKPSETYLDVARDVQAWIAEQAVAGEAAKLPADFANRDNPKTREDVP